MRLKRVATAWLAGVLVVQLAPARAGGSPPQSGEPLPVLGPFLAEVRRNLVNPEFVLQHYRHLQRVTERERDGDGRVSKTTVDVYDVRPNVGSAVGHRVLIEKNGRRLPQADPIRLEEEQRRSLEESIANRTRERPAERQKRLAREVEARLEEEQLIADVFRVYDFRIVGRETLRGERTIVIAFSARPGAEVTTSVGRVMRKTAGCAWVGEDDRQVIRVELESWQTLTYGLGILARVRPGARLVYDRQRTSDGTWVPASYHLVAEVRLMLVKPMRVDREVEYYDFRPFALPRSGLTPGS
jgi:hypothetical protein